MSLKGAHRPPTAAKPKKHRLEGIDDVILYTTQQANPVAFLYELECARFSRVDFTLDFSLDTVSKIPSRACGCSGNPFLRTRRCAQPTTECHSQRKSKF